MEEMILEKTHPRETSAKEGRRLQSEKSQWEVRWLRRKRRQLKRQFSEIISSRKVTPKLNYNNNSELYLDDFIF